MTTSAARLVRLLRLAAVLLAATLLATGGAATPAAAMAPEQAAGATQAGRAAPTAEASGTASTAAPAWGWPLTGRPAVVRPFQPPPEPWLPGHRGVDLRAGPGAAVLTAGDGVVAFAGVVAGVPVVSVDHPAGPGSATLRTTYQPVTAVVHRGDVVHRGEVLGTLSAAASHCAPDACLHWGLRRGATYLDPLGLLGVDLRVRLLPVWDP